MEGLQSLYDALQEEIKDCEALAIWRARAQMMYSHLIGETSIWPCQKEVDDFLANGGTMAEFSVPVVDVDELAKTADTASTGAIVASVAPLVEDVSAAQQEEGAPIMQQEGDVPVVAPQEETLEKDSTEMMDVVGVVVPSEQEEEIPASTQEEI